jgi:hypothetical protein
MRRRVETLLSALDSPVAEGDSAALLSRLDEALANLGPEEAWLAISVLSARFPDVATVKRTVRAASLDGPLMALFEVLRQSGELDAASWPRVEVLVGRVIVDLHHTARSPFATGIQRVARETARRWLSDHEVIIVGWTDGYACFRRLSAAEVDAALLRLPATRCDSVASDDAVVVPWKCKHLVAELPVEPLRTSHYQSYVRYSRSTTGLVGHDCVPLMAAETTAEGMPIGFANYLAVAAGVDRIAVTCKAAELEFRGWHTMLGGAGQSGPEIKCVPLPVHAETPTVGALREARDLLCLGSLPVVLSVGSHEPRKNHLAL